MAREWMRWVALGGMGLLVACSDPSGPNDDYVRPTDYLSYEAIVEEMLRIEARFPTVVQVVDLTIRYGVPATHEGRHIQAVRVSDHVGQEEDEPTLLIVAAHHANEISTPVAALDALYRLTSGYEDGTTTLLVDENEIWIAPVWNPDGYPGSRKNARPEGSVDLNRNYPFLWESSCSGSTDPQSGNFKGPTEGSEPEVITMIAFAEAQRFTKVIDYHSFGRETLYAYRCSTHRQLDYLRSEAFQLSLASGYGGRIRPPSAEGEHYQWQLGAFANLAFLTEVGESHTPVFAEAVAEAAQLWSGVVWMLERPVPIWGHVSDASSGLPLEADVTYLDSPFTLGERNRSEPRFGRFHAFLPLGLHTLRFSKTGYVTQDVTLMVTTVGVVEEVALVPVA